MLLLLATTILTVSIRMILKYPPSMQKLLTSDYSAGHMNPTYMPEPLSSYSCCPAALGSYLGPYLGAYSGPASSKHFSSHYASSR
jgi:hypothetical protein